MAGNDVAGVGNMASQKQRCRHRHPALRLERGYVPFGRLRLLANSGFWLVGPVYLFADLHVLANFIGPLLIPFLIPRIGFNLSMGVASLALVISAVIVIFLRETRGIDITAQDE
jgi:hypothetical protein